jgi:hypothetical protein
VAVVTGVRGSERGRDRTDVAGYVSEAPAMSAFALQDGTICQTYATAARGSSS